MIDILKIFMKIERNGGKESEGWINRWKEKKDNE